MKFFMQEQLHTNGCSTGVGGEQYDDGGVYAMGEVISQNTYILGD